MPLITLRLASTTPGRSISTSVTPRVSRVSPSISRISRSRNTRAGSPGSVCQTGLPWPASAFAMRSSVSSSRVTDMVMNCWKDVPWDVFSCRLMARLNQMLKFATRSATSYLASVQVEVSGWARFMTLRFFCSTLSASMR